jgi:hypothetical protein
MAACEKHPFDEAKAMCGRCAYHYCQDCLVFHKGAHKAPLCIPCALLAAGVKTNGGPIPRLGKKELKAELKAQRIALKDAAKASVSDSGPRSMPPHLGSGTDIDWAAMEQAEAAFRAGPSGAAFVSVEL